MKLTHKATMEIQNPRFNSIFSPNTSPCKHNPLNYKTQSLKSFKTPEFSLPTNSQRNKPSPLVLNFHYQPNSPVKYIKQTTSQIAGNYHVAEEIHSLTQKLKKGNLSPLQILQDDGDWSKTQFWGVIKFLQESSRNAEILEVFNAWTKLQESRINELNYVKLIGLLSELGMMNEATLELQNMKNYGLKLCSEVYNSIIHGYSREGKFDDVLRYLNEMEETGVNPDSETYDVLIKAYGKFGMYDEMVKCLKRMENNGCMPDHVTYNLLIHELSKAGLLNRMERMYHTLISKRMELQSSTLVAILEAYADFGVLDKMERFYIKVRNSKTVLKEQIVRKIARVYVENHMFSRLDDLAKDLAIRKGRTNLYWCLRLLSYGGQSSKKGMDAVLQQMEENRVSWNVSIVNTILFAYLKMKDFKQLDMTFSKLPHRRVQPDFVTFSILYDGHEVGFEWSRTLKIWSKNGFLEKGVEVKTDPLVFTAVGKGAFYRTVEKMSTLLEPKMRKEKLWTYETLLHFVLKHRESSP